jgi:antirestriction protein
MSKVYVSTYHNYNSGNLNGAWVDCENFSDKEDFIEHCLGLFPNEQDPELMFQDYEDFPKSYYSESNIKEELWDDYLRLDANEQEIITIGLEHGIADTARDCLERFQGVYNSSEDWAQEYLEDTGMFENVPKEIAYYFDFEAYARDCQLSGDVSFIREHGQTYVFNNH